MYLSLERLKLRPLQDKQSELFLRKLCCYFAFFLRSLYFLESEVWTSSLEGAAKLTFSSKQNEWLQKDLTVCMRQFKIPKNCLQHTSGSGEVGCWSNPCWDLQLHKQSWLDNKSFHERRREEGVSKTPESSCVPAPKSFMSEPRGWLEIRKPQHDHTD